MNCQESYDYMMKYFDGDMNDIEQAQFRQHLKACKSCSENFESMSEIFGILKEESGVEPPLNFEAGVMQRLEAVEEARRRRTERILFAIYSLATAILGVLTFVFIIDLKDSALEYLASASAHSGVVNVIYFIVDKFYYLTDLAINAFKQLGIIASSVYYYLIAAFAVAYFITRPELYGGKRRGHESSEQ